MFFMYFAKHPRSFEKFGWKRLYFNERPCKIIFEFWKEKKFTYLNNHTTIIKIHSNILNGIVLTLVKLNSVKQLFTLVYSQKNVFSIFSQIALLAEFRWKMWVKECSNIHSSYLIKNKNSFYFAKHFFFLSLADLIICFHMAGLTIVYTVHNTLYIRFHSVEITFINIK